MANNRVVDVFLRGRETVSNASKKAGDALKKFGIPTGLIKVALLAMAAALGTAVMKFAKLEKAMINVGNLTGATRAEVNKMTDDLLQFGSRTPQKIQDLAEALFDVQSAGINAGDSLAFLETAAKLATAGATDVGKGVDILTSAINAYGLEASAAEEVANQFFNAQVKGKTTIEELAGAFGRIAPVAKSAGIEMSSLLGTLSTLTASGLNTNEAVTGLKATISAIIAPTDQAKKEADKLGLSFDGLTLKEKGLAGFLEEVINKTGGSNESIKKLFGSTEAMNSVLSLSNAGFEKLGDNIKFVAEETTTLTKANEEMNNSLSAEWGKLNNKITTLGHSVVKVLNPALMGTLKLLNFIFQSSKSRTINLAKSMNVDELNAKIDETSEKLEKLGRAKVNFRTGATMEGDRPRLRREKAILEAELKLRTDAAQAEKDRALQAEADKIDALAQLKEEKEAEAAEKAAAQAEKEAEEEAKKAAEKEEKEKERRDELAQAEKDAAQEAQAEKEALEAEELEKKDALDRQASEDAIALMQNTSDILLSNEKDKGKAMGKMAIGYLASKIDAWQAAEIANAMVGAPMSFGATLSMIAPIIAAGTAGKAALGAIKFHDGGVIGGDGGGSSSGVGFSGNIRSDERPAILQTGEEVLSRSERSELIGLLKDLKQTQTGGQMINVTLEMNEEVFARKIIDIQSQREVGIV